MKTKLIVLLTTLALSAALFAVASASTGAFFSDTKNGAVTGTIGTVLVSASGGVDNAGTSFVWENMLPGEVYSATLGYQNTGASVQDVYLTFPNATALSALNSLGRYGAVKVWVNDTVVYYNTNLNDFDNNGTTGLPASIPVATNVGPTASGKIKIEFQYAPRMTTQEPGGVFNKYPVPQNPADIDPRNAAGFGQKTVLSGQVGSGLPFALIATQPGKLPGTTFPSGTGYAGF